MVAYVHFDISQFISLVFKQGQEKYSHLLNCQYLQIGYTVLCLSVDRVHYSVECDRLDYFALNALNALYLVGRWRPS